MRGDGEKAILLSSTDDGTLEMNQSEREGLWDLLAFFEAFMEEGRQLLWQGQRENLYLFLSSKLTSSPAMRLLHV